MSDWFHLWWSGRQLHDETLLGFPVWWWARIGKVMQQVGLLIVILELIGPERLKEWQTRLERRQNRFKATWDGARVRRIVVGDKSSDSGLSVPLGALTTVAPALLFAVAMGWPPLLTAIGLVFLVFVLGLAPSTSIRYKVFLWWVFVGYTAATWLVVLPGVTVQRVSGWVADRLSEPQVRRGLALLSIVIIPLGFLLDLLAS